MNLLVEVPGQRRSRLVFFCAVLLAVMLFPLADALLERWMPSIVTVPSATPPSNEPAWDLRSEWR